MIDQNDLYPESVNWSLLLMCVGRKMRNKEIAKHLSCSRKTVYLHANAERNGPRYHMGFKMLELLDDVSPEDFEKCTGQSLLPLTPIDVQWRQIRREIMQTNIRHSLSGMHCVARGRMPMYNTAIILFNEAIVTLGVERFNQLTGIKKMRNAA